MSTLDLNNLALPPGTTIEDLLARLTPTQRKALEVRFKSERAKQLADLSMYKMDPVGYAKDILRVILTPDQGKILNSLLTPPYSTLVPSGHACGKTLCAAVGISWWYDTRRPCGIMVLGPRHESLKDTVWAEVRMRRQFAGLPDHFIGPAAPEMRDAPDHWAKALTASKDAALTGRHLQNMMFLFEEAVAVEAIWWQVISTMFDPAIGHARLAIFNPTNTGSQAYIEDCRAADDSGDAKWTRIRMSSLNHPNLAAELRGEPPPFPGCVSLAMVREWLEKNDWAQPVEDGQQVATDVRWPPEPYPGRWWRPGPELEARAIGIWPQSGSGVWGDALWSAITATAPWQFDIEVDELPVFDVAAPSPSELERLARIVPVDNLPEIGCDCGQGKGEDYHGIHGRWGRVSLHHETANTMDAVFIFAQIKTLAEHLINLVNTLRPTQAKPLLPTQVPIKLDDDGTGNAVGAFLKAAGYTVTLVGAATLPQQFDRYPRRRDELWFYGAARAKLGLVNVARLDTATRHRLRQQLMAPKWSLDPAGRRKVEPKDETKKTLGRSPDDADAMNLAYADYVPFLPPSVVTRDDRPPNSVDAPATGASPYEALAPGKRASPHERLKPGASKNLPGRRGGYFGS